MTNTQAAREYRELVQAGEAAQAFGEFAYAVKAATEFNEAHCPITHEVDCKNRYCELHYMDAPLKLA